MRFLKNSLKVGNYFYYSFKNDFSLPPKPLSPLVFKGVFLLEKVRETLKKKTGKSLEVAGPLLSGLRTLQIWKLRDLTRKKPSWQHYGQRKSWLIWEFNWHAKWQISVWQLCGLIILFRPLATCIVPDRKPFLFPLRSALHFAGCVSRLRCDLVYLWTVMDHIGSLLCLCLSSTTLTQPSRANSTTIPHMHMSCNRIFHSQLALVSLPTDSR